MHQNVFICYELALWKLCCFCQFPICQLHTGPWTEKGMSVLDQMALFCQGIKLSKSSVLWVLLLHWNHFRISCVAPGFCLFFLWSQTMKSLNEAFVPHSAIMTLLELNRHQLNVQRLLTRDSLSRCYIGSQPKLVICARIMHWDSKIIGQTLEDHIFVK